MHFLSRAWDYSGDWIPRKRPSLTSFFIVCWVFALAAEPATAQPKLESDELEIRFVTDFDGIFADYGSGADSNFSTWRPKVPPGFLLLGDYAHNSYNKPNGAIMMVVKPKQSNAVKHPVDYDLIWGEWGSGADQDGTFWAPRCPSGYVGMGSLSNRSYNKPSTNQMVCVRQDLTTYAKVGKLIWGDWGSGADRDGTFYRIELADQGERPGDEVFVTAGSFTGHSSYEKMTYSPVARALKVRLKADKLQPNVEHPPLTSLLPPPLRTTPQLAVKTYLPAIVVDDPAFANNAAAKMQASPIYVLERYDYYHRHQHHINEGNHPDRMKFTVSEGMTQTESKSFTDTFSISYTSNIGVEVKVFSAGVSVTLSYLTSRTVESASSISRLQTRQVDGTVPAKGAGTMWSLGQRYELKRWGEETPLKTWTLLVGDSTRYSVYDPKDRSGGDDSPPSSGGGVTSPPPPSGGEAAGKTDDVIWQHRSGQIHYWKMDKGQLLFSADIHTPVSSDWTLVDTADVDGDGTDDLIWQHANGQVHYWPMKAGKRLGGLDIHTPVGQEWTLIGGGDVNGDGTDDLVWQRQDGQVHYWAMKHGKLIGSADIYIPVLSEWSLIGVGDLNRDGTDDILWRHDSGQVHYWPMKNGQRTGGENIFDLSYPKNWTLRTLGDVNGNGIDNPIWQRNDGQMGYWRLNNGQYLGGAVFHTPVGSEWTIRAVGDIDP